MSTTSIAEWSSYLGVQAEVAATLTGLVFIAVSINISRVLTVPGLAGRAVETILLLLGTVVLATDALIPGQSVGALGIETLAIAALLWVLQSALQIAYIMRRAGHPKLWLIVRLVQTHLASVPFLVAGVLLWQGSSTGLYWLAPGFVFSLIAGVLNAWILLVEILR